MQVPCSRFHSNSGFPPQSAKMWKELVDQRALQTQTKCVNFLSGFLSTYRKSFSLLMGGWVQDGTGHCFMFFHKGRKKHKCHFLQIFISISIFVTWNTSIPTALQSKSSLPSEFSRNHCWNSWKWLHVLWTSTKSTTGFNHAITQKSRKRNQAELE